MTRKGLVKQRADYKEMMEKVRKGVKLEKVGTFTDEELGVEKSGVKGT